MYTVQLKAMKIDSLKIFKRPHKICTFSLILK